MMEHPDSSSSSPGREPPAPGNPDVDGSAARQRGGVGALAFVALAYEQHHADVFSFLARATRDRSPAEALLEQAYRRLATEAREGLAPLEPREWLYRTAAKLVAGRAGRQATAPHRPGRKVSSGPNKLASTSQAAGVIGREPAEEVERALDGLSADARLALLLSGEGFGGEAIAAALDQSVATTRTLLSRARTRVRIRRDLFAGAAR